MKRRVKKFYRRSKFYRTFVLFFKRLVLPGFGGIPLFYVINFFFKQLYNETITMRASAIAFNFLFALIPGLIFLFSLIPFFPVSDLEPQIYELLQQVLPENAFLLIKGTLVDILLNRRSGLLSFGFLTTVYFATNGIYGLLEAFTKVDSRTFWKKRLISFFLFIIVSFLLIFGISVFILGEVVLEYFFTVGYFIDDLTFYGLQFFQLLMIGLIIFIMISILYYFGSEKMVRYRLFSPGSLIATVLLLATSYGFAFYVDNFSTYNKFFGSLGTLMGLMLWFYFNSIVIIIGFEFNQSIILAQRDATGD